MLITHTVGHGIIQSDHQPSTSNAQEVDQGDRTRPSRTQSWFYLCVVTCVGLFKMASSRGDGFALSMTMLLLLLLMMMLTDDDDNNND